MPTTCVTEFENNPLKVVYSGQILRGTVDLTLTSEKIVRAVYIKIIGNAQTYWTEGTGDKRKSYKGSVEYLNDRVYLAGRSDGKIFQCVVFTNLIENFVHFFLL